MRYNFPVIEHIDQVLPAIKDKPEFIVAEREGYKVVNYKVKKEDTFDMEGPDDKFGAIRRECRGIIFSDTGEILSRRYHKFFNVSERPETSPFKVDLSNHHHVLSKEDGTMITPLILNDRVFWATKMGITDISYQVQSWVETNIQYQKFARYCHSWGYTPIFEWCSLDNRVVLKHDTPKLVLTGMRHTVTGSYLTYEDMVSNGNEFNIGVVQAFDKTSDILALMTETKALEGEEGYVIRFSDGHMAKLKSDWYVAIHRTKELFAHPRHIINLFYEEILDDTLPLMTEEDQQRTHVILSVFHDYMSGINEYLIEIYEKYANQKDANKVFALSEDNKKTKEFSSVIHKAIREIYGVALKDVYDIPRKHMNSNINFDRFAKTWFPEFYERIE